jgi:hypothetical protein
VPDPGVLEQVLLVRGDHGLLPALTGDARIDSTSSQTVTYSYSVEDGSRGLPTCWATSPACFDTSGTAVSRRNASNSRSLPTWIVGLKTRMITAFSFGSAWRGRPLAARGR